MRLRDLNIVITGGTSGIGREIVDQLVGDNQLIVMGRSVLKLADLKHLYPGIRTYVCDLSDLADVKRAGEQILKNHTQIDVLMNNAAVQYTPRFLDDDFRFEKIEYEITVNFTAICVLIALLLPGLRHKGHRAIILNVSSVLGMVPKTNSAVYCASKGALNILSQSLRYQFEQTDIRVLQAVLPLVETPMTAGRGKGKISAASAASSILSGLEKEVSDHFIGMAKYLRLIHYIFPPLARKILKGGSPS
ncbi:MAG: SDR family NAD(P)-dependent oxidoreductase [Nitrospirae bacterium]|nr:SDR family NAD(P)-dependent oxidoreductase [Candidatus Manganitrophaceae bacterium]